MPTRKLQPIPISRRVDGFVSQAVRDAVKEISVDQKTADPGFVIHLAAPTTQNIYFADGGRRAAQALLRKLNVRHDLLRTQREL
jgi:hypothetical protein